MDLPAKIVVVVVIVIIALIVITLAKKTHKESLLCNCERNEAAATAWITPQPACVTRWRGQSPFGGPNAPCSYRAMNPYFPIYGSAMPIALRDGIVDAPISRMVGDHVPPE